MFASQRIILICTPGSAEFHATSMQGEMPRLADLQFKLIPAVVALLTFPEGHNRV